MQEVVAESLKYLPDALLPMLHAPDGAAIIDLHQSSPKAFHLGGPDRKMTGDGTLAVNVGGRVICFVLQAEETTGLNLSSLCGKAALALFAADSAKLVTVKVAVPPAPPTGLRGRPQSKLQPVTTTVDEAHILFLCEQDAVHRIVEDLQRFFAKLKDHQLGSLIHCLRVDPSNIQQAAELVQTTIDEVCASRV